MLFPTGGVVLVTKLLSLLPKLLVYRTQMNGGSRKRTGRLKAIHSYSHMQTCITVFIICSIWKLVDPTTAALCPITQTPVITLYTVAVCVRTLTRWIVKLWFVQSALESVSFPQFGEACEGLHGVHSQTVNCYHACFKVKNNKIILYQ